MSLLHAIAGDKRHWPEPVLPSCERLFSIPDNTELLFYQQVYFLMFDIVKKAQH